MSAQQFTLPDLLAVCPLKDATNPHYAQAAAESTAWVKSYNIFDARKLAFLLQGSSELLVSHAYPYAPYEQFRTCCDFVNLLFVVDEVSDDQNGKDARRTGEVYLNVMRYPDWDDGSALAKMTREFKQRLLAFAGPNSYRRFLMHCDDYVNAVAREAEYRERGEVLDIDAFQTLRRENSAIRLCFGLFEFALGIDLPDFVFQDPHFMTLYWSAADMVCWSNDVYSYNMEQAKGHTGNNIVTVLMRQKSIGLQEAADLVGAHFSALMGRFVETKKQLPSFGAAALDDAVAKYVAAMEHWVIGNLEWSFESQRYFGAEHTRVKATRVVVLSPADEN
ncbi:terpenoid synthase [Trametes versicolor FP-101664 SS1]|uniref:terpenoid synthase n=1 Tax=Trametes versicolor (strain FP-101664) TaxID=717944 RepID=UPI00046230AB|nr:terpenoid synthase [Trametes versicolor FP-101664 SS1]EIW57364.1 terpenoid synthase [Trametes versicolor FP-101664 SS1]